MVCGTPVRERRTMCRASIACATLAGWAASDQPRCASSTATLPGSPMDESPQKEVSGALRGADLLPMIYAELRRVARSRMAKIPPGNTLRPTDLVHEAYLRLAKDRSRWNSPGHFFVAAAEAMRRILVEQARRKSARKHGGGLQRLDADEVEIPFTQPVEDILSLHEAIERLEQDDPRKAQVVVLRCFAGLTREETAAALEIGVATVDRDWRLIVARLHRELSGYDQ